MQSERHIRGITRENKDDGTLKAAFQQAGIRRCADDQKLNTKKEKNVNSPLCMCLQNEQRQRSD